MANAATQPPIILPDIRQLMSCCTPTFRCQAVSPGPDWPLQYEPRGRRMGAEAGARIGARSHNHGERSVFRRIILPVPVRKYPCSALGVVARASLPRPCQERMARTFRPPQRLSPPPPPPGSPQRSAALVLRAARSAASRRMIQNAAEPPLRPGASPSANSGQAFEMRLRRCSRREALQ
jgi:hypothetical protein